MSAYHQSQSAGLLSHVADAMDRHRAGEIDVYAVDKTIHHYHRAAGNSGGSVCPAAGMHAEFIADLLDRVTRRRRTH